MVCTCIVIAMFLTVLFGQAAMCREVANKVSKDKSLQRYASPKQVKTSSAAVAEGAISYCHRGKKHCKGGDYKAIADYDYAPSEAEIYSNSGKARSNRCDYKGAIADYGRALRLNPNDADTYYNRAVARNALGDAAISDYTEAIRLRPSHAKAYNNRGFARKSFGEFRQAIADYDQAIKLEDRFTQAYDNRGFAHNALGEYEAAMADFDRAILLNSDFSEAYIGRGDARRATGNFATAIDDYRKGLSLNRTLCDEVNKRILECCAEAKAARSK